MVKGNESGGIANRHVARTGGGGGESQRLVLTVSGEVRGEKGRTAAIRESLKAKGGHRFSAEGRDSERAGGWLWGRRIGCADIG